MKTKCEDQIDYGEENRSVTNQEDKEYKRGRNN
jgi:hypothetical protein